VWLIALLALAGCRGVDPELRQRRAALDAWRAAEQSFHDGDVPGARRHLDVALRHRPGDPVLLAWAARAAAADGDLDAAVELGGIALATDPTLAEARYNLAAWHARRGDVTEAARELRRALEDGVSSPVLVAEDPDFVPWLDHPSFSFLPGTPIVVTVEAPEHRVFWGSEFDVRLRVLGAQAGPIGVTAERADGPAALVRVVESPVDTPSGPVRDLVYTFRVTGAGSLHLGPLHVWSGRRRAFVDEVVVEAAAPPDRAAPPPAPYDLATPGELLAVDDLAARRVGDEVRLTGEAGDVFDWAPDAPAIRYETRGDDRVAVRILAAPPHLTVTITRGADRRWDGPVSP
jgi:hypothetical protein